jgi:hypothetical protein
VYQPYPGSAQAPEAHRPPPPAPVRNAVLLMYAGAALSVIRVIADVATRASLRADISSRTASQHLTAAQVSTGANGVLVLAVAAGVISIGLWIFVARASQNGSNAARITGSVLFGLGTVALLTGPSDLGLAAAQPTAARICTGVVWLAGLGAVVLLWQRSSSLFFGRASS